MKKVGKTTRPFRYDLYKIPYDHTVEVRNRFKGLDLTDRVPDKLWTEVHDIVQETGMANIPVFLPGESHGQRSLAGYSPWGCKESDMTEQPNNTNKNSSSGRK